MFCKYCGAELEEGVTLCPACNREIPSVDETTQQPEQNQAEAPVIEKAPEKEPEKRTNPWLVFLTAFCGALAGVILVCAVLYASGVAFRSQPEQVPQEENHPTQAPATAPTVQETEPTEATMPTINLEPSGQNDLHNKLSYTVSDDQAAQWSDKVIATVGDKQLTNGEFQLYYWSNVYDFLNNYSYYLSGMGLDYTKPLDQQMYMDGTMTWEQFFLQGALMSWHKYCVLNDDAKANQFALSQETQDFLSQLPEQAEGMLEGTDFSTFADLLKADMGAVATADGYYAYMTTYYSALEYFNHMYEAMVPTEDQVLKFFRDNEATYAESGITMDGGKYYDVRHILIEPKGGVTAEDGSTTYTDAQWEACRMEAQAVLDKWKEEDGTEAGFAALAAQLSTDGGSAQSGGLYTNLTTETNFVTEFKDWYLDESREVGSTGLVKSVYGYHIMYFSASRDIWYYEALNALQQETANKRIEEMMNNSPMEVTYENIAVGFLKLG